MLHIRMICHSNATCTPRMSHGYKTGMPRVRHRNVTHTVSRKPHNLHKICHSSLRLIYKNDFLIFAADTQKCNKGSIKKASSFPRFQFLFQLVAPNDCRVWRSSMHSRKKSAGVHRKMHSHGCKVIIVSLLRPYEKMTMD